MAARGDPEKRKQRQYRWAKQNPTRVKGYIRRWRWKVKIEILSAYSGGTPRCVCCGETEVAFLTLDHVNGGGRKHRAPFTNHRMWYLHLRRNGYPNDPPMVVMCWNCNCGRRVNGGTCPHHVQRAQIEFPFATAAQEQERAKRLRGGELAGDRRE